MLLFPTRTMNTLFLLVKARDRRRRFLLLFPLLRVWLSKVRLDVENESVRTRTREAEGEKVNAW